MRILCKYLHSNGYDAPCAFHPAPHVNKCFVPYIFTKDEIERLFSAVDCTKESSESPLRHLVMPVLFRLLYTCGLRVSEALHLKVADVDLDAGVLAIYGAKGDKERLVGISDSMLTYMKSYRSNPLVANAKVFTFSLLLMADSMIQVQFTIFFENAYLVPGFHTEVEEKGLVSMISGIPLRSTF